ncbi:MAG TPA: S53 family peptidase [Marmoricola sp.]
MRKPLIRVAIAAGALLTAGLAASTTGAAIAAPAATNHGRHAQRVCAATGHTDVATCFAKVMVNAKGRVPNASTPPSSAMTPTDLRDAYKLTGNASSTVAIVDAYGYPNLERDLNTYRSQFGLGSCTTASGCLRIINQSGGTSLPRFDAGWAGEQALDVDAVSAICPGCKIVVVQASSASIANLGTAVNTAARQAGVVAISNSYGGGDLSDATYGSYYNHSGIAVTASTGDNGYQGGSFPASSHYVTAVGGTTLRAAGNTRGWSETAWSGAGSGCSTVNAALADAAGFDTGCGSYRAIADVSAAADPNYGGMAVYYPTSKTSSTWAQVGGTSEASPIIASVYALSGNTAGYANAIPYQHSGSLFDVTSGSNGTCSPSQECNARSGWDGPTGLGTPNGTGAF